MARKRRKEKDRIGYVRRLYRIFKELKRSRGKKHEDRFFQAMAEGKNFPFWYRGIRQATIDQDHNQIDAVCDTDIGELYVQIKSSHAGRIKFEQKYPSSKIACIVISELITQEEILQKTLFYLGQKRQLQLFLRGK